MEAGPARRSGGWCEACGSRLLDPDAETCPRCGAAVPSARRRKSRIVAALLAFAFGAVGSHRFYLGQSGLGTVYLLLSWTLVPGLVSLVDFVRLIAMTDAQFQARYGRLHGGGPLPAAVAAAAGVLAWAAITAVVVPRLLVLADTIAALPR